MNNLPCAAVLYQILLLPLDAISSMAAEGAHRLAGVQLAD